MKERWELNRSNVLRHLKIPGMVVKQHHWNTWANENYQLNPGEPSNRLVCCCCLFFFCCCCCCCFFFVVVFFLLLFFKKRVREKSRECHSHKPRPSQTPRGRGNRQIQTSTNRTNVRKALRLALSSPSEVIAMPKGLKNSRTKWHKLSHKTNRLVE